MSASFTTLADFVTGPRGEPNAVEGRAFLISCRLTATEPRRLDDKRKGAADTKDGAFLLRPVRGGLGDLRSCGQGQWFVLDSTVSLVCRRLRNRFCVPRAGTSAVRRHWIHSDSLDGSGRRTAAVVLALWGDLARVAFVALRGWRCALPSGELSLVLVGSLHLRRGPGKCGCHMPGGSVACRRCRTQAGRGGAGPHRIRPIIRDRREHH